VGVPIRSSIRPKKEIPVSKIMEAVDVRVPVRTAYDQWTQFESFPAFMEGVKSVRQLDDTTLEWVADVAGRYRFRLSFREAGQFSLRRRDFPQQRIHF
jgi:uncharacterized membrane protein